jgi:hypothetical protein
MSQDQNTGRSHGIKIDNSSFERVEQFRYLGTNLINQSSIQEENRCRLKSQNACYHSVQIEVTECMLSFGADWSHRMPAIIRCRLKSQNVCYHSVQNLLSSSLLSKDINIKVHRTTIFLFCKGVKLGQNKRRPSGSHCWRTLKTVTPVTRLWKGNG